MPRQKKLDLNALFDSMLTQIEARLLRVLRQDFAALNQRLDKIERALAIDDRQKQTQLQYKICSKAGCRGRVVAHGLCSRHYQQWRYYKKKAEREQALAEAGAASLTMQKDERQTQSLSSRSALSVPSTKRKKMTSRKRTQKKAQTRGKGKR